MKSQYKYLQVKDKVLANASLCNIEKLPSERELCLQFKISRTTARKALNSLNNEKMVVREVGRGTFLIPSRRKTNVSFIMTGSAENLAKFIHEEIRLFSADNPSAEIEIHSVPSGKLIRAARELPGAKVLLITNTGYLIEHGLLAELDSNAHFSESTRHINSQYVDWMRVERRNSHCYSIPFALNACCCSFNRRHAEILGLDAGNGPKCMDGLLEWLKTAKTFNQRINGDYIFGTNLSDGNVNSKQLLPISFYLSLSGGRPFLREDGGNVVFDFSHGREWIELFKNMREIGGLYDSGNCQPHPVIAGNTLFNYEIGSWAVKELEEAGKAASVKFMPFPPKSPEKESFSSINKLSLAIFEDGMPTHPSRGMAWSLIRHLSCELEPQRRLADKLSFISMHNEVFREQSILPSMAPFMRALATGVMRSDHPVQHSVIKVVRKYFFEAVYDLIPVDMAVERIEEICRLLIELEMERSI